MAIKNWFHRYWGYILIFCFFLYMTLTSARAGDDWEIANWYSQGAMNSLVGVIRSVLHFNGRILTNFFDSFFSYYDTLWVVTTPIGFTLIIYLAARLFKAEKNWLSITIGFLILLSVSNGIRTETYTNIVGNVAYFPAVGLILLYLNIIFHENTDYSIRLWPSQKINNLLVGILALAIGLWTENVTLGFLAANVIIIFLSWLRSRKIPHIIISGLMGSIISCIIVFGTPGFYTRYANMEGSNIDLFQRVLSNTPVLVKELIFENIFIYLVFLTILAFSIKNGIFNLARRQKYLFLIPILVMISIISLNLLFEVMVNNYYSVDFPFIDTAFKAINNLFFNTYNFSSIIFSFLIFATLLLPILNLQERDKILVLLSLAMGSAFVMAGSPYLGARTFVLAIVMILAISAFLASKLKFSSNNAMNGAILLLGIVIAFQIDKFFLFGQYVMEITSIRNQMVQDFRTGLSNGRISLNDWLVLPAYKMDSIISTANPDPNSGHMVAFKQYFYLPQNAKVIIDTDFAYKEFNVAKIDGLKYRLEVIPLHEISQYSYKFYVQLKQGEKLLDVFVSDELKENSIVYEFPGPGIYVVSCFLSNPAIGTKLITAVNPIEIK